MKLKKSLLISSSFFIGIVPLSFVISCSSSSSSDQDKIKETAELQKLLDDGLISPLTTKPEVKGLVEKYSNNWSNKENFLDLLSQYFNVDNFKTQLNNNIYNKIKKFAIQSSPSSNDLSLVIYLNTYYNDVNIASATISNANSSKGFLNKMTIKDTTQYDNEKDFNDKWNEIQKGSIDAIKEIINKAFGITSLPNISDKVTFDKYFSLSKSTYSINLSIKKEGKEQGYIFDKDRQYLFLVSSKPLVNK